MSGSTIEGTVLDHVAHAVNNWSDVWDVYATELGAVWNSGDEAPGYAPGQIRFGNGARAEMLMPNNVAENDFLARFLARSGPGPHHLTFKVPDLDDALAHLSDEGIEAIGVNTSQPMWMEAFIHPRQATGVVVQVAQAVDFDHSGLPPSGYPTRRRHRPGSDTPLPPASLLRVVQVVADLDSATTLFGRLLAGSIIDEGSTAESHWRTLSWDGPLGLRLTAPVDPQQPGPLVEWLGGRVGRIHHLELVVDEPQLVDSAVRDSPFLDGVIGRGDSTDRWVVEPNDNAGLALVLTAP
jgi:hypothetical protein